jgi:predicted transcriptional regulator
LNNLANETKREQGQLIEQAVGRFLDHEEKQLQMIRDALEYAEKYPEEMVDDDKVQAWVDSLGTANELPPPILK